ncbi:MAG: CBASS cGAMP synthase [Bradyrhizobium sp.]|uniref:CBASS cGAMP synthase n=1 Tax=Bradyrhizobium sp. TaxID=376 RepID=UPI002724A05D|nr:CBASS cGAMP synthase [Bradyrhizobium sp.]MDO8396533.1 CBASS cGAMP synthase [Bradyrhizobium sp.]
MANVAKLLHSNGDAPSFLKNLQLDDNGHSELKAARAKVRRCLRAEFAKASKAEFGVTVQPRFFTQGSYAYKTINEPAWTPPQQKDLDDGAYLPMTFVQGAKPSVAAAAFFTVVDRALQELAKTEGWKFVRKPTCARLIISNDAHIDVPLYAIPDAQFMLLEKALQARTFDGALDARADSIDRWDALPSDCVLLAHREEGWKASDPRKIHDWFVDAVELYGERLRRVCRYLKAWRDHNRPHLDGVSSILLMVCAWEAFEDLGRPNVPDRDDKALLSVAERLPRLLAGPVCSPTDPDEKICARLDDDDRRVAVQMAGQLQATLTEIVEKCFDPNEAVRQLNGLFGDRIPDRIDLVDVTKAAHAEVRSHPVRIAAAPEVGKSVSA